MGLRNSITIDRVNLGGTADSDYAGGKYSVARLVGWDLHSEPGVLKVRQKLTKASGSVVTEFCKVAIAASNGDVYFFSSTSGKIWKAGSPYTLAYTTTPEVGDAGCLGAYEYQGYIYWCTEKRGHRIPVNATALADWATYADEDVLPLNLEQAELGGTGQTETLPTSIDEGATNRQTFVPFNSPLESVAVNISDKGTGNWTLTVHDSSNNTIGSKTIANASLAAGWNFFEFSSPINVTSGSSYHIHIVSTVADGVVVTDTTNDLEGGNMRVYRVSDDEFHPMIEHFGVLFIGDKHFVHQVEKASTGSHSFTTQALDLPEPYRVKSLGKAPFELLIGTTISSSVAKTQIFVWDTYSDSFTTSDEIPEVGINAFLISDNRIFVHAGLGGSIYIYDPASKSLELFKKIRNAPGQSYTPSATASVHSNAVATLDGQTVFGLSNTLSTPADAGVYVFARRDRDYPYVLDLSYPISQRSSGATVLDNVEIGAIVVSGFDMYVSWKNSSTYGVDELDYAAKFENAFIESRLLVLERDMEQNFARFVVAYRSRPTNTALTLDYRPNHANEASEIALTLTEDTTRKIYVADSVVNAAVLQVKVSATVSTNDGPELESVGIYISS